ncbi:GT-D fold domain-containing glycosyltransferase [Paenibacillus pinistramenti]|uniref:GT-D fold domain-containing protein n=1 Tax=Paenibacillus pinistramenti TaxID=1768003 RepID=UPI001EF06402|nr:GT-D fold domain-containing glycosyltransferase [Paenibacillus pinistramenti]
MARTPKRRAGRLRNPRTRHAVKRTKLGRRAASGRRPYGWRGTRRRRRVRGRPGAAAKGSGMRLTMTLPPAGQTAGGAGFQEAEASRPAQAAAAGAGALEAQPAESVQAAQPAQPALPEAEEEARRQAVRAGYQLGYQDGWYEGGEALVARLLPPNRILAGITAGDLIALGLRHLPQEAWLPLLTAAEVAALIRQAMDEGRPLSIVRLGDGELLTLAHDTVIPAEEAQLRGPFLPYAGVELPAPDVREALAAALGRADIIGVPESRHPSFQGLLFPVLSRYGYQPAALRLTSSTVNYSLAEKGLLLPLLQSRRVLLIGNKAEELGRVLEAAGIAVSGIVSPVLGARGAEQAVNAAAGFDFDIALVSAGIAAVLICEAIAGRYGKVALDFGHMANKLESGEALLR